MNRIYFNYWIKNDKKKKHSSIDNFLVGVVTKENIRDVEHKIKAIVEKRCNVVVEKLVIWTDNMFDDNEVRA